MLFIVFYQGKDGKIDAEDQGKERGGFQNKFVKLGERK